MKGDDVCGWHSGCAFVLCSSPAPSHWDVLPWLPGDQCQCLLWWTVNTSQSPRSLSNKSHECLGALLHDWKIYCYKQQKSIWGSRGVGCLKKILISQVPTFQFIFTKGVIKLEGPVGTERTCYQCCSSEGCASIFHENLLFSNGYK